MSISTLYYHTFFVLRPISQKDSGGSLEMNYADAVSMKGHIEKLSGNRVLVNEKNEIIANYRLFTNFDSDIEFTDRIEWNEKIFTINSIDKFEDIKYLSDSHMEIYLLENK